MAKCMEATLNAGNDCGIGRQSLLANGKCFQWLSNQSLTHELNNGRIAGPGEVPFAVWIVYRDKFIASHGSGVILNNRWILTAAHVIYGFAISDLTIYPGKLFIDYNDYENGYNIEKTVVHYKYPRRRFPAYDMALIKLTADLPLSSQLSINGLNYRTLLNGICLPPLDALNSEDELALMAGYGLVNRNEKSDRLKIGYIRIKKPYNNARDFWRMIILGERYPSYNGTFSCAGDSGAPLYQYVNGRAVLIGITKGRNTITYKCDEIVDSVYVVFVRISLFVDWIIDSIHNNDFI
ncbi:coagulation factor IX-like [Oppia nitens]|uniref:coagulation factor IX-like n=1 Tax=Oppia nitens TaxID=1686743 RepID=UPI0023DC0F94|nr:coagulation factor IX-like [Oppia nitens]